MKAGGGGPRLSADYQEALSWLYGTQRFGIKLGLENIRRLLAKLGLPGRGQRFIHVAGTNGKGSVCAMVDAICRAAGYRTGLFTSPHLVTFRERIQINGEMIPARAVSDGLLIIRQITAEWQPAPTFFETTTALALRHFAGEAAEIVVLETGMGGRLDATNAVQPVVSVITPIGLDHQTWLGATIAKIAAEKAGIIKHGVPVVSAAQEPAAEEVLRARASECGSEIHFITEPYTASSISLAGAHQKRNAALAIAALRAASVDVGDGAVRDGLASLEWPARFQMWDESTIVDGAHNAASAEVLAQTWRERFGNTKAALVFGILRDKEAAAIYRALSGIVDSVFLPEFRGDRATDPNELAAVLQSASGEMRFTVCQSVGQAITAAHAPGNRVLITGSLHLAGEALAFLRGEPAAFEECTQ
ncbi:MAG: folylpolyglutamate synthase/dihydrofolate synthase family protein [Chthoniobacterales bacterium]